MAALGKLANWLFPPLVSEVDLMERGVKLKISTSEFYTKLTVDGVEFFFNRESGKYDGWGAMER